MPSFPTITSRDVSFLAGFLEGEACFLIWPDRRRQKFRCGVSVSARDDDEPLLRWIQQTTGIGSITWSGRRGRASPQLHWRVGAKAQCLHLIDLLDGAPLWGRKRLDFAIWRKAVLEWSKEPLATCPKATPLALLREELGTAKEYRAQSTSPINQRWPGTTDWAAFLSGFVTAEGSFGIWQNGPTNGLKPRFIVRVRRDDQTLLEHFRSKTDLGRVYLERGAPAGRAPAASWHVIRAAHLLKLVAVLDDCQPGGRKGREYRVWREAATAYASDRPRREIQGTLAKIRASLDEMRKYPSRR
jgi:hypothetical protein